MNKPTSGTEVLAIIASANPLPNIFMAVPIRLILNRNRKREDINSTIRRRVVVTVSRSILFLRFSLGLIPPVICHLVKPRPFRGRDYLWVTDQRNREATDRKNWKNLARPEGLEPPTYRFEVVPGTHSQGLERKRYPIFVDFTTFLFSLVSVLPVHSGHELVTNNSPVNQPAYRFTILRSLNSYGVAATCRDLIPAYDHSMWGLYGSLTNASTVRWHQKALRSWTHSHSIHHKGHRTLGGRVRIQPQVLDLALGVVKKLHCLFLHDAPCSYTVSLSPCCPVLVSYP